MLIFNFALYSTIKVGTRCLFVLYRLSGSKYLSTQSMFSRGREKADHDFLCSLSLYVNENTNHHITVNLGQHRPVHGSFLEIEAHNVTVCFRVLFMPHSGRDKGLNAATVL